MKIKTCITLYIFIFFTGLILSCKSTEHLLEEIEPEPLPAPLSMLTFENVEAETPEILHLNFCLDLHNTALHDAELLFQHPTLMINGFPADETLFSIELPEDETLTKQERRNIPLRLSFRASEYEKRHQQDFDEYGLVLTVPVQYVFADAAVSTFPSAEALFPRVRKPDFIITTIKIMQAELINTRLKVSLQIDNPNHFPVELTSFNYELYGDGRFWSEGEEKNILKIPAKESAGIDVFLTMNFTNMRRNVLNQVIAMTEVRYRFKGNADVETGTEHLPRFTMDFEQEGYSEVLR